jgi:undecaprenyl-diphosphatase
MAAFLLLCLAALASAEGFRLDPLMDGLLGGTGLASAAVSEYLFQTRSQPRLGAVDPGQVNAVDSIAVLPYSGSLDAAADVTQYTAIAIPLLLGFFLPLDQAAAAAVVYGEALAWAYFLKDIGKYLLPRYRPFIYAGGTDISASALAEQDASFPSGHATMSFAAAAFGAMAFAAYFPSSPWLTPFVSVEFGLAALTASLRVAAGMHFLSDVAVGALVGAGCGLLIPLLHEPSRRQSGVALSAAPGGIVLAFSL